MNLIKKDIYSIFTKSKSMLLLDLILLIVCQIFILVIDRNNAIEVFFNSIALDAGYISNFETFFFPTFWFLLQLLPTFIVSYAIYDNHINNSSYDVLKTRSRNKYFFSKILAALVVIILLNALLYILIMANVYISGNIDNELIKIFRRIIISYILVEFVLFYISFVVGIKLGFKFAISSILIQLILSMTSNFKYFIGQQALAYKQDVMGGYISLKDNIICLSIYLIVLLLVSLFIFSRYDFYGGDNDWSKQYFKNYKWSYNTRRY